MPTHLSPRERQIVRLLSLGCTVKQAAAALKISVSTADNHKLRAMDRLGVNKVALLTRVAIKEGISPLNDKLTALEKRRCGRKDDGWS